MGSIGLIVNPLAGIGGRLGLKGSDGAAGLRALLSGAPLVSPERARAFLAALPQEIRVITPPGKMGSEWVGGREVEILNCVSPRLWPTSASNTMRCAELMEGKVDLLVFVGGDGTARDVLTAIDSRLPVLGVPAGVKVYSAVFAPTPKAAASLAERFLRGEIETIEREVLDIDEDEYRRGRLSLRLYGYLRVPSSEGSVVGAKVFSQAGDELEGLATYIAESMESDVLYILGPGKTTEAIAEKLGVRKTPLGVDAIYNGALIGKDLDERGILELLSRYPRAKIIVSPIGGQGFVLGRGNQQLSPAVIKRVGVENIIIVSAKSKLSQIRELIFDTGDEEIDGFFAKKRYVRVVVGYGEEKLMRVYADAPTVESGEQRSA